MKVFWALMAVIAIAAIVLLTTDLNGGGQPSAVEPITQPRPPAPPPVIDAAPAVVQTPTAVAPPTPASEAPAKQGGAPDELPPAPVTQNPAPVETPDISPPAPAPPAPETPPPAPAAENKQPVSPFPVTATESTESENLLIKMRQEIEAERAAAEARRKGQTEPATEAAPPSAPAASSGLFGDAAAEQKPDGTLLVDGKYTVSGKGTQEDPYKITWDQLISAERDYAPKDGKKTIPARIKALDDAWVEITGYVAFPIMANETDEMLSMMNQWDGCCIGIPPTPYDAIEVRLSNVVAGDARLTTYGVVKGKFKVDPHLVGGWLVGLYVIDHGTLTPKAFGGVAP